MVIGPFPVVKLGALLVKQLSKPIANYIKEKAKTHPTLRKTICLYPARFYHWCEIQVKMWVLNLGKPVHVPPLNEAMAIELGSNLVGEMVIYFIACAIFVLEYQRNVTKQAIKEKEQQEQFVSLKRKIEELSFQTERQEVQIKELLRHICDLDSRVVKVPWKLYESDELDTENTPNLKNKENFVLNSAIDYLQMNIFRDSSCIRMP